MDGMLFQLKTLPGASSFTAGLAAWRDLSNSKQTVGRWHTHYEHANFRAHGEVLAVHAGS
jgi:hypothetical protein